MIGAMVAVADAGRRSDSVSRAIKKSHDYHHELEPGTIVMYSKTGWRAEICSLHLNAVDRIYKLRCKDYGDVQFVLASAVEKHFTIISRPSNPTRLLSALHSSGAEKTAEPITEVLDRKAVTLLGERYGWTLVQENVESRLLGFTREKERVVSEISNFHGLFCVFCQLLTICC